MVFWGKPKSDDLPRLIINPSVLSRLIFPIQQKISLEVIAAGGLSFWPESGGNPYIHPDFTAQRQG